MKAFKAYDIRGVYGQDLTDDLAYQIGRCLPAVLHAKTILVCADARLSAQPLRKALTRGLLEAGADVTNVHFTTTPMCYFLNAELGFDASVMVTASHNPKEYNGFKVCRSDARPCGYDQGLREVEAMIESGNLPPPAPTPGNWRDRLLCDPYLKWLRERKPDLSGLRFLADYSNGAAGPFGIDLLGMELGCLNGDPDGRFPWHGPDPLNPKNREELVRMVRYRKAEVGLIFDGDGDRVCFVDAEGTFIPPDAFIPLIAEELRARCPDASNIVVHDVRTSRGVIEALRERGFEPRMVKVGAAFAKTALRESNGLCGGEVAGHYYFRDFHWSDSGIYAALIILGVLARAKREGRTLHDLIDPIIGRYVSSGEVNIPDVTDRPAAVARVEAALVALMGPPEHRIDYDGVRLDWPDAWLGVRPSNTEPLLRIAAEAKTQETLDKLLAAARSAVNG